MIRRLTLLLLAFLAGGALAAPEGPHVVKGEVVVAGKARPAPKLRLEAKAATPNARLAPVADSEVETLRRMNRSAEPKRLMIGVNREAQPVQGTLPTPSEVRWTAVEGGSAARFSITSPDALGLRLALDLQGVPLEAEMVFFGSGSTELMGPVRVGDIADRISVYWSPPTEGDTQTVEVFVPQGRDTARAGIRITQVSHLFTSAGSNFRKRAADIGDSGSCNVDIACVQNPSQNFLNTRQAVAKMLFTVGSGSGLCTGTLLNDTDGATQIPWFYTANHCFEANSAPFRTPQQMQTIANTLTTYWFFEAVACNSLQVPNFVTRTGGATYVYNNQPTDVLFLRLNDSPPAGSFLSGYSTQSVSAGSTTTGIHHPQGDLKKVSQSNVVGFSTPYVGAQSGAFTEVRWFSGTTEGGSSGSGLWSNAGGEYLFRGGLWGGSALCSNPQGTDNYSRFDLAYPQLRQYLETAAAPFADFTDLWWNPSESGWGLNLIQHPTNQIFGVWYTYDATGKRIWFVMSGGTWVSSSTFTGDLYQTSGPPYNIGTFNTANVHITRVGSATLNFTSADAGTWTYSVNGVTGVKQISRQPF